MSRKCMGMAVTRRNCMIGYVPPLNKHNTVFRGVRWKENVTGCPWAARPTTRRRNHAEGGEGTEGCH